MSLPVRLLYVDDNRSARETRSELLSSNSDITVIQDDTVDSAVDRLSARQPDCVLSRYSLPDRDGIEFLRAVRKRDADLPFILLVSASSPEIKRRAVEAGATKVVSTAHRLSYRLLQTDIYTAAEQYHQRSILRDQESTDRVATDVPR